MKLIYTILAVAFLAFIGIFMFQNFGSAEIHFLGYSMTLPIFVLSIGFYVMGAITSTLILGIIKKGLKKDENN